MKNNKISKNWISKQKKDIFFRESKIQGYRSRSAFKLIEMNKKFKILRNKQSVLDLGAAPGGWSQVVSKTTIGNKIVAVDLKNMEDIDNVHFIKGDFQSTDVNKKIMTYLKSKSDVVLSDMAANTSGNKTLDSYRTGELCLNAMNLAVNILTRDGVFLSKIFMGSIFNEINEKANKCFKKVIKYKPKSSKKESKEIYIFCKGLLNI